MSYCIVALSATVLLAGMGCERPFVEVSTPRVTLISPDVSKAVLQPFVPLRLTASSFRPVTRVLVNGQELINESGQWTADVAVIPGLNRWVIESIDEDFVSSLDTVYVLRVNVGFSEFGPRLPTAVGAFGATKLAGGAGMLVSGGAQQFGAPAVRSIFMLRSVITPWEFFGPSLIHARAGHTASLLPDAKVLVAGGGSRDQVATVGQLVEAVEIIDLETISVKEIPVVGDPIRRTDHSTSVRITPLGVVVDLFGGVGDITYSDTPRLGTRSDVRSFLLRNDSLFALHPGVGPSLGPPVSGHSQTQLRVVSSFTPTRHLYLGASFGPTVADQIPVAFEANFADSRGIVTSDASPPVTLRTNHADVLLSNGMIGLFGGRIDNATDAISSIEVFSEQAGRFFEIPVVSSQPLSRFSHKATRLLDGSILVVGGFKSDGLATTTSEVISLGF